MNRYKYLIFTIILFLTCMTNTYAACTQEEINEFKKIEDEYVVKYEFDKATKTYRLYFKSTQPDKYYYRIYSEKELECNAVDKETMKCINFPSGDYGIEITGITDTCDEVLKTIELELPKYNYLSEDPLCNGIEEFVLCNPTYNKEIDYDTFVSRVNTYKKKQQEEPTEEELIKVPDKKEMDTIIDYLKNNWISLLIILIFVILVIITIIVSAKNIRKSRYLE